MAVIMVIATPFFYDRLPLPAFFSVLGVIVLSLLAGLTNPKMKPIIVGDFIVALVSLFAFGYESTVAYQGTWTDSFFWCNLILAILSVFAVYLSSKTLRGFFLN